MSWHWLSTFFRFLALFPLILSLYLIIPRVLWLLCFLNLLPPVNVIGLSLSFVTLANWWMLARQFTEWPLVGDLSRALSWLVLVGGLEGIPQGTFSSQHITVTWYWVCYPCHLRKVAQPVPFPMKLQFPPTPRLLSNWESPQSSLPSGKGLGHNLLEGQISEFWTFVETTIVINKYFGGDVGGWQIPH